MKRNLKNLTLVAIAIVYLYLATQSFRADNWGVFVIDVGIVGLVVWYLFDQRGQKTNDADADEERKNVDAEQGKRHANGQ